MGDRPAIEHPNPAETERERQRLQSLASAYTPKAEERAQHLRELPDSSISPSTRMGLGYHENSKDAAAKVAEGGK